MTIRDLRNALNAISGDHIALPKRLRVPSLERHVIRFYEKALPWMRARGVQGMGIAEQTTREIGTGKVCIKIYVATKRPRSRVADPAPTSIRFLDLEPITIDVEEIGQLAPEYATGRFRPAMPGASVGHPRGTGGTLGCFVVGSEGRENGNYLLSNAHVLARWGRAEIGQPILQPSAQNGGQSPRDVLAKLSAVVPYEFSGQTFPNLADAAIARVPPRFVRPELRITGERPNGSSHRLRRNMRVKKVGATTGLTAGIVRDLDFKAQVLYPLTSDRRARIGFRDQVLCTRFTEGGDSGSAVLDSRDRVVGLHHLGSSRASVFCKIRWVEALLGIQIPAA